jgi:methylated-DNA-[protein]-cysteine S-methyltransferase
MSLRHAVVETTLGELTLVAEDGSLTGLYFPHHWNAPPRSAFGAQVDAAADDLLVEAGRQLGQYLTGDRAVFDLPIRLRGNDFQRQVWRLVAEIPRGQTVTYGDLARRLGADAKAVGQAVGQNPLCIVVPCHRVVGKNGKLTGYAGGLERKKFLLDLEEPADIREARLF